MAPCGCTSPYSSFTAYAALFAFTPEPVSVIMPETVTGTILPFGGHKTFGVAERVITGGVVSAVLFSITATRGVLPADVPTTKSRLPSPFKSATARDLGSLSAWVTAAWNV